MNNFPIRPYSFATLPLCVPVIGNDEVLMFAQDWNFYANGHLINIPKGYKFECSIPFLLQPLIGSKTNPAFWAAAGAHDYCFETHCLPFKEANDLFKVFLLQCKVPEWKIKLMKFGVGTRLGMKAYYEVILDDLRELYTLIKDRADKRRFLRDIYVSQWSDIINEQNNINNDVT